MRRRCQMRRRCLAKESATHSGLADDEIAKERKTKVFVEESTLDCNDLEPNFLDGHQSQDYTCLSTLNSRSLPQKC